MQIRAFLPLLLVLISVLSGAACRGDEADSTRGEDVERDDSDASPIAGAIQGSFSVSSTGEPTYVLPLIVPPGAAGMQPSLAIAYNSASGDGMLGMGFSLSGLSAVTRCPRSMAQDGQVRGVRYDEHDALCLDGARLIPVGNSDGVVEYRTLPDTFVKVLAFPSNVLGNPADTLKVFTRSGLILEYGSAPDARVMGRAEVIRSWLAQRVRDRSENTIAYEYLNQPFQGHGSGEPKLVGLPAEVEPCRATNWPKPYGRVENQRRAQILTQRRKADAEAQKYEEGERRFRISSFRAFLRLSRLYAFALNSASASAPGEDGSFPMAIVTSFCDQGL